MKYQKERKTIEWIDPSDYNTLSDMIQDLQKKSKEYTKLYPGAEIGLDVEYESSGFEITAITYFNSEEEYRAHQEVLKADREARNLANERALYEKLKAKFN